MLLFGVVFWAATFVFIKEAVAIVDVFSFISVRFILASLILSIIFIKRSPWRRTHNPEVVGSNPTPATKEDKKRRL